MYGIRHGSANDKGNNRIGDSNNFSHQPQTDLAKKMGMTMQSLQNYKKLTEMIPELEELVNTGIVTNTTALAIMRNLSEDEQINLISSMDTTKKITQKQAQQYIDKIKQLEAREPQVVKPDDYDSTKQQHRFLENNAKTNYLRDVIVLSFKCKLIVNLYIESLTYDKNHDIMFGTVK